MNSSEWEDILRPTATYLQTSDEAFKEVVQSALGEVVETAEEDEIDLTRQFSPEEIEELQQRIEEANRELAETQAFETLDESVLGLHLTNDENSTENSEATSTESVDIL
ncbi:Cell division initiation protein DivIVA [Streptococcus constellatus]|nr:Cell division initiation protein DivIVA [Streptococcus constellatus]